MPYGKKLKKILLFFVGSHFVLDANLSNMQRKTSCEKGKVYLQELFPRFTDTSREETHRSLKRREEIYRSPFGEQKLFKANVCCYTPRLTTQVCAGSIVSNLTIIVNRKVHVLHGTFTNKDVSLGDRKIKVPNTG